MASRAFFAYYTGFQIYDPEGNLVTMTFTYPTPTVIDTFYTDSEGVLVTPEKLPNGKEYKLVEVASTYGYTLSDQPLYFDVTAENGTEENGLILINVTFANQPQMGTITVTKTGEIFASVKETDGMYQPVYEIGGLEGTVYEIIAVEDVHTPDGTLRYSEGEVVDTITVGPDGTATSKPLHLGKFAVKEVTAVHGITQQSKRTPKVRKTLSAFTVVQIKKIISDFLLEPVKNHAKYSCSD